MTARPYVSDRPMPIGAVADHTRIMVSQIRNAAATLLLTACQNTYDGSDNALCSRAQAPQVVIISPAADDRLTTSTARDDDGRTGMNVHVFWVADAAP